jgi:hypothetical protein
MRIQKDPTYANNWLTFVHTQVVRYYIGGVDCDEESDHEDDMNEHHCDDRYPERNGLEHFVVLVSSTHITSPAICLTCVSENRVV